MTKKWRVWFRGLLALGFLPSGVLAQIPEGDRFQIDQFTANSLIQVVQPDAVGTPGEGFTVVWASGASSGDDSSGSSIQGRRYASDGSPLGDVFQINSYTTGQQAVPSIATAPNGDFVVVWGNYGANVNDPLRGVHVQRFASDGSPVGDLIQIVGVGPFGPAVAMSQDSFVVVWHDDDIFAQQFASDGTPLGGEIQVNTYTTGAQVFADVAMDASGGFVVSWSSEGSTADDDSLDSIQVRSFDSAGMPLGDDFQVNTYTTQNQRLPRVGMAPGGDFVVVWQNSGEVGGNTFSNIRGQRFAADGSPLGGEFQSSADTEGIRSYPDVGMRPERSFVVVWEERANSNSSTRIHGRLHGLDGVPQGSQFQTSSFSGTQFNSTVAAMPQGNFVVAWSTYNYTYGSDNFHHIEGQRYREAFFADGFEDGDTSGWSNSVP